MKIQKIDIKKVKPNEGQIDGLPKNPRFSKDHKYKTLLNSIQKDPEMLELRELIVYPVDDIYVAVCGNMRLHAQVELGYKEVFCKVLDEDTTIEKLKAYSIKDNVGSGDWDFDALANDWDFDELTDWGVDLPADIDFSDLGDDGKDYGDKNKEIDTDEFSDKMILKIELPEDDYHEAVDILKGISESLGDALMEVLSDRKNT